MEEFAVLHAAKARWIQLAVDCKLEGCFILMCVRISVEHVARSRPGGINNCT